MLIYIKTLFEIIYHTLKWSIRFYFLIIASHLKKVMNFVASLDI